MTLNEWCFKITLKNKKLSETDYSKKLSETDYTVSFLLIN